MNLRQAILATLAYHDIFDYPLTIEEIHQYLIGGKASLKSVEKVLNRLTDDKKISRRRGYYYLRNHIGLVNRRLQRKKYSKFKFKKALFFANLLKIIPTLKLVAISAALAMENSHKDDDIDLILVTSKGTLWTTRFLANILLFPFKRKPQPQLTINHSPSTNNKACLNIFLDESSLKISDQNLYTAHETCQMKPIWDRDGTYSRLVSANNWVKKFLPNWQTCYSEHGTRNKNKNVSRVTYHLSPIEIFLKKFQLWYMRSKITTEKIEDTQLFFHPQNKEEWVMGEYQKRLKILGLINRI